MRLVPADPAASPDALAAIANADQIVLAPGSLYTSIVAVLAVPALRNALRGAPGRIVQVANLATENETAGHDGTDHLRVVVEHGARVDDFLYDPEHGVAVDVEAVAALGTRPVPYAIARSDGTGHDARQLAQALSALL